MMERYVTVKSVISEARRAIERGLKQNNDSSLCGVKEIILKWLSDTLNSIQPDEVREEGEWLWHYRDKYKCSVCGTIEAVRTDFGYGKPMWRFCPDCGARMINGGLKDDR